MNNGVSPVVATVLLIAVAVIASVTVWFWVSSYTTKPAMAETAQRAYTVTASYKNSSNDGCVSIDIKNNGGLSINNAAFELRDYRTGEQTGTMGTMLSDPGLVSYWRFDESAGIWANDSDGGNNGTYYGESFNNGSFTNTTNTLWVDGKFGSALSFGGGEGRVTVPHSPSLNMSDNFTIGVWLKLPSQPNYGPVIIRGCESPSYDNYMILIDNGTGMVKLYVGKYDNSTSLSAYATYNVNEWHYYTGIFTSNAITMYKDGVQIYNTSTGWAAYQGDCATEVRIGSKWGANQFKGLIDSLRIWNRVLNRSEIQAEMASSRPVVRPIAAWEFDEGSGTAANDTHIWTKGAFGSGLSFDGINDYVQTPTVNAVTVSMWVQESSVQVAGDPTLYNQGAQSPTVAYWWVYTFAVAPSIFYWQYSNGTNNNAITIGSILDFNTWTHVVFAVDTTAQTLTVYKNGAPSGVYSCKNVLIPSGQLSIGTYQGSSTGVYVFNGSIDDVTIFNRSLSVSEVAKIYKEGRALGEVPRVTTLAYVNITAELAPGDTYRYNLSSIGNSSNITSIPIGTYLLRPSGYSSSVAGLSDKMFTCA